MLQMCLAKTFVFGGSAFHKLKTYLPWDLLLITPQLKIYIQTWIAKTHTLSYTPKSKPSVMDNLINTESLNCTCKGYLTQGGQRARLPYFLQTEHSGLQISHKYFPKWPTCPPCPAGLHPQLHTCMHLQNDMLQTVINTACNITQELSFNVHMQSCKLSGS